MAADATLTRMPITLEEVRHVARLARLDLDAADMLSFQGELNALLGHFADIEVIDAAGLDPEANLAALQNVWADDSIGESLPRAAAMGNASTTKGGLFIVPSIIEG